MKNPRKPLRKGYHIVIQIKKGAPLSSQTVVNLKSNTMKNTMQRYNMFLKLPIIPCVS